MAPFTRRRALGTLGAAFATAVAAPQLAHAADGSPSKGRPAAEPAAAGPHPPPRPLAQAHAHNDYEHPRPLLDALDHRFTSVEADIFLTSDDKLLSKFPYFWSAGLTMTLGGPLSAGTASLLESVTCRAPPVSFQPVVANNTLSMPPDLQLPPPSSSAVGESQAPAAGSAVAAVPATPPKPPLRVLAFQLASLLASAQSRPPTLTS